MRQIHIRLWGKLTCALTSTSRIIKAATPGETTRYFQILQPSNCVQTRAFRDAPVPLAKVASVDGTKGLDQKSTDAKGSASESAFAQEEKQTKTPWHRDGSNLPPVEKQRPTEAMAKGKLLTTPSRLLKLIIPLTPLNKTPDGKDVEPLALLVHPQQPLSYLERLIQSELPSIRIARGEEKVPAVHFRAENSPQDEATPRDATADEEAHDEGIEHEGLEETQIDGKVEKTGKLNGGSTNSAVGRSAAKEGLGSFSGLGNEEPIIDGGNRKFVRWSSSTEIGDFIREAARGKEFAVEIEGAADEIRTASQILTMAEVKKECDIAAHKGAQRVAIGGAGLLMGYWYIVYRLTFETELGWDTMEPVTYLVGLSTLICGYLWFLYHNREVSYRTALNLTISRRQTKLYQAKGFDLQKWESLVDEGNTLRREIKAIAQEYDVDWDEKVDEKDETVTTALKEVRKHQKAKKEKKDKKDDDDDDD